MQTKFQTEVDVGVLGKEIFFVLKCEKYYNTTHLEQYLKARGVLTRGNVLMLLRRR